MAELKKKAGYMVLPLCLGLAMMSAAGASEVELDGNWQYGKQKVGDEKGSTFNQGYSVAFGRQLTEMLDYSAHVAYRHFNRVGAPNSESLAPSINIGLHNDIFSLNLLGSATESDSSDNTDRSNRMWEIAWRSAWQKRFWPDLRASYSEDTSDSVRAGRTSSNQENKHTALSADWGHRNVHLLYSYTGEENMNKVSGAENQTKNHLARFETSGSFLDRRGTVSFSQQYLNTRNDFSKPGPPGTGLVPATLLVTMAQDDTTPLTDALNPAPGLHNGNLTDNVVNVTGSLVLPLQQMNFGMEVHDPLQVDWIYLYTWEDLRNLLPPATPVNPTTDFRWELYVSTDGINWEHRPGRLGQVSYDSLSQRFEVPIIGGVQVRFLKLVLTNTPATLDSYWFSEIEAYRQVSTTGDRARLLTDNKTYLTNFGMGYRFNPRWRMAYNFAFERGDFSEGEDLERQLHSSSLIWDPNRLISTGLSVSESRTQHGDEPDDVGRSYGVSVLTTPLHTVDVNFGATRTESYKGGEKQSTTNSLDILTNADLYRELNASLNLNYSTTKSELIDDTTRNLGTNVRLTARLAPALTADLAEIYNKALSAGDPDNGSTNLNISWRLSDYLSVHGGGSQLWADNSPDSTLLTAGLSLAPTPKTQVSLNYGYLDSTVTSHVYNLSWNLLLSRHLSLQASGNYQVYDEQQPDMWSIYVQLFARFSGM